MKLNRSFFNILSISLLLNSQNGFAEISSTWEQEASYSTSQHQLQKFESSFQTEMTDTFGKFDVTAITRIKLDSEGNLGPTFGAKAQSLGYESRLNDQRDGGRHVAFALRELYFDAEFDGAFWRVGKQQVVWGQSDGLKVLDQVNPQTYSEFILDDFDDSRIPLWMVNLELPFGDDTLQFLWIPDASTHELSERTTSFELTSKKRVPKPPLDSQGNPAIPISFNERQDPNKFWEDSDVGVRYSMFTDSAWDITFNYLYHYQDLPVLYQQLVGASATTRHIEISPVFERSHLIGGTLSNAFGDFTVRAEWGYSTDTYFVSTDLSSGGIKNSPELSTVIGLDYQGISDMFISFQWFHSHLFHYDNAIVRGENDQSITLLIQRDYMNETLRLESLFIHNINDEDGVVRPKIIYQMTSDLELFTGADLFYGNWNGLFGQFDRQDRLNVGFKLGF
jgi:hypothetical protein